MKLISILFILSFCISCEDPCWQPNCRKSTEFRFNLIDSLGNDLIIGDSTKYTISQLKIRDSSGNHYSLEVVEYFPERIIVVGLSSEYTIYEMVLDEHFLDSFSVQYELVKEKCCGWTAWIKEVQFVTLRTEQSKYNSVESTYIYID